MKGQRRQIGEQVVRFGIVGIIATGVFLASTVACSAAPLSMSPTASTGVAMLVSILVSYLGHYFFTFAVAGAHHRSRLPRFLLVSLALAAAHTGLAHVLTRLGASAAVISISICISYPFFSFMLNRQWVFRSPES